jgi:hypothetical protein
VSFIGAAFIFMSGLSVGLLLAARRRYLEIEQLKIQARDYRLQAVALKDLCRRLDRVSQLPPHALHSERESPSHTISPDFTADAR